MDVVKKHYLVSKRWEREPYCPAIAADGSGLAFIITDGRTESLVYKATADSVETLISGNTYILDPHFAGKRLYWVEKSCEAGNEWSIRTCIPESPLEYVTSPFLHIGRPMGIDSFTDSSTGRTLLVWEEREGTKTKIMAAYARENWHGNAFEVTDGSYNAYDPSCAVLPNGTAYVAYCAFYKGNYRIFITRVDVSGCVMDTTKLALRYEPAVYPSIFPAVAGGGNKGIWLSFTTFKPSRKDAMVNHFRRRAQHEFTGERASLNAAYFDGKDFYSPRVLSATGNRENDLTIDGMEGAGHSRIIEDERGGVHILFRQHVDKTENLGDSLLMDCHRGDNINGSLTRTDVNYPDLCITSFDNSRWIKPRIILQNSGFEYPISYQLKQNKSKNTLYAGIMEDGRAGVEWMDKKGKTAVGILEIELKIVNVPGNSGRYIPPPVFGPSLEEPVPKADNENDNCISDGNNVGNGNGNGNSDIKPHQYRCALGQLHAHTAFSRCNRSGDRELNMAYRFMQDVQHCDFGACTDHGMTVWNAEIVLMNKYADYYYFPGKFVAIPAYEWTSNPKQDPNEATPGWPFGHFNPLMLEEKGFLEVLTPVDAECAGSTPQKLIRHYQGQKIVAAPHHPACHLYYNWDYLDSSFHTVVEIFQDQRGSYEMPVAPGAANYRKHEGTKWIVDVLKEGKKFGFVAGADHGGLSLAGILTEELTRTGLYDALKARRTYGTTGNLAQVNFTCNGNSMGAEVICATAEFRLAVNAADEIFEIQLVRNGETVDNRKIMADTCDLCWNVEAFDDGDFWYARIIFDNGDMAWPSPIWLMKSALRETCDN